MGYNDSFMDTSNNLYDIATNVNEVSNNNFFIAVLFTLFVSVYLLLNKKYGSTNALLGASSSTVALSSIFWLSELIPTYILGISMSIFAAGLIVKYFHK